MAESPKTHWPPTEIAKRLGVSAQTVYYWITDKRLGPRLKSHKTGGRIEVWPQDLQRFLAESGHGPESPLWDRLQMKHPSIEPQEAPRC